MRNKIGGMEKRLASAGRFSLYHRDAYFDESYDIALFLFLKMNENNFSVERNFFNEYCEKD